MQREAERTIQTDMNSKAGVTVTASYGSVEITANAEFAYSGSTSDSSRSSSNYAKDIIDRSLSKIQKRMRQERVRRVTNEIEETNTHGLKNTGGADHIIGIYRWIDKYYDAQVYNYGKRLMFEFVVPEPAAFYIYSQNNRPSEEESIDPPIDPSTVFDHKSLEASTYGSLISYYKAQGVSAYPPEYKIIATAMEEHADRADDFRLFAKSSTELKVPDGYKAVRCYVRSNQWGSRGVLVIQVGNNHFVTSPDGAPDNDMLMMNETESIPVSIFSVGHSAYVCNIEILCERTPEKFEDWQLKTYAAILTGYQIMKSDYDDKKAARSAPPPEISIAGQNPLINRRIEKEELKKHCIMMLTNQDFSAFNAVTSTTVTSNSHSYTYPEINIEEAKREGKYIQFFEQAFEWDQITYLFYEYFWGRKPNWINSINMKDNDPLFLKFLQSGAARVIVPVRPAYENAILHYIESDGEIWNGGDLAVGPDHDLFVSIVDELRSEQDLFGTAVPEGKPWEVTIPTSLVYLQKNSTLPNFVGQ